MNTMALKLALICAVAALALAQVDGFTREPIRLAEARAQRQAVEAVLPSFAALAADTVRPGLDDQVIYFTGRDSSGAVAGTAFTAVSGLGYSGEIEVMVGLDTAGRVNGVRVLRHAETPGLGANYTAPDVLDAFYGGKDASTDWRVTKDGGDVDAITGATVTGRALCDAIDGGYRRWAADRAGNDDDNADEETP
jgi:electron transport complex protein RnfG